jgi:adenylate cyclase
VDDVRRILDPATPLRLVGDLLARLSRDRLAQGGDAISMDDLRAAAAVGPEELERAALNYALRLGPSRYTLPTIASLAGLSTEEVRRLWLALGFAQPQDNDTVFTDGDLVALSELRRVLALGGEEFVDTIALARLVGESFARISEALVRLVQQRVELQLQEMEAPDVEMAVGLAAYAASSELGAIDELLTYAWKRHLAAAIRRAALRGPDGTNEPLQCIGFADIAGFTRLAARLDHRQLAEVLESFQVAAYQAVVVRGSRVVKTVGDEIMFVTDTPELGVVIAEELSKGFRHGDEQVDLHIGLAWGAVLCRDGDYYGPTVNLASRLCDAAPAGGVLLGGSTRRDLAVRGHPVTATFSPVTPPGLGPIEAWLLTNEPIGTAGEPRPSATSVERRTQD